MNTENNMEKRIPGWLVLFLAAACGLVVANLYYAQPLVGPISSSTGISSDMAGFIVTMTQLGYAAGLLLLVPLSDLLENRKLVVTILAVALIGLLGAGTAANSIFCSSRIDWSWLCCGADIGAFGCSYGTPGAKRKYRGKCHERTFAWHYACKTRCQPDNRSYKLESSIYNIRCYHNTSCFAASIISPEKSTGSK